MQGKLALLTHSSSTGSTAGNAAAVANSQLLCCLCCRFHAVLDLDPNRLRELLTAWTTDWAGKNWQT
jgi:hypothetical protein